MEVSFIHDTSSSPAKGFYIINDLNIENTFTSEDLNNEKLVGHHNGLNVFFIKDHTSSPGKGFYLFKNSDGQIIPSLSMSTTYSAGKSTTQKNVGVIYTSSINHSKSVNMKIIDDNNQIQNINQMSSQEVFALSQTLLKISKNRQIEEENSNSFGKKIKP